MEMYPFQLKASSPKFLFQKTAILTPSRPCAGHGWGVDEDNCAEFCDHTHHFTVNGVTGPELTKTHPTAGNEDGCKTQVLCLAR